MTFEVIPAIDLRNGRVVRLRQGDYARETGFAADPLDLARRYADEGARWLHVVDLDGARAGAFGNLAVIESLCALDGLQVQAGGGVRGEDDLRRLYGVGVARVLVGSLAVRDPGMTATWLGRYGRDRLVPALDVRGEAGAWRPAVHGWTEQVDVALDSLVAFYARAGAQHVLCTDIGRDGTLGGFNLDLYRDLRGRGVDLRIHASGGARSLEDIREVREAGVHAVILGRGLLEGNFSLKDALQC
jgi:phosphoribosylformimino-5-aminoimidazole carboxamide ribotide isomerase